MILGKGCASNCNSYGDLLFYTNEVFVWDTNHQIISNSLPTSAGVSVTPVTSTVGSCYPVANVPANNGERHVGYRDSKGETHKETGTITVID